MQKSIAEFPKLATKVTYQNPKLVSYRISFSYQPTIPQTDDFEDPNILIFKTSNSIGAKASISERPTPH